MTSKKRITVPIRASGKDKAQAVAEKLTEARPGYAVSIRTAKGVTTLKVAEAEGEGMVLRWSVEGQFQYGSSTVTSGGKSSKVRNVSGALRAVGI